MSRRKIGIHGIQQQVKTREDFSKVGEELASQQMEELTRQMSLFKSRLVDFASTHARQIRSQPAFRSQFHILCMNLGVDPLVSSKNMLAQVLGMGDFYYELGIQVAQICIESRPMNGGLMDSQQIKERLAIIRPGQEITHEDLERAIQNLKPLGAGFDVVRIGARVLIQSIPKELTTDFREILALAASHGYVTLQSLIAPPLCWDVDRAQQSLDLLLKDGICWIDMAVHPHQYYVASYFLNSD